MPDIINIEIDNKRICGCKSNHINCLTAKEWLKSQIGVWQFNYESRDIRDKSKHPAVFPISLASRLIQLFSHAGELVIDPFVGSGTVLIAARDNNRNAVGFDLKQDYINLCNTRLDNEVTNKQTKQLAIQADARNVADYLSENSVKLLITSPPYANLLNRKRKNKSRRGSDRKNEQYLKIEQYSQDPRDLGTLNIDKFSTAFEEIFKGLFPVIQSNGHLVIDVPDIWMDKKRITLHMEVVDALRRAGYEFRNTIIWDRTNIVNRIGIFGWPSNYITMGTTFEYLLHFMKMGE